MDACFTALYLDMKKITEANPLIAIIIDNFGLLNMIKIKIFLGTVFILILFYFKKHNLAKKGINFVFYVYLFLMLWQLFLTYFSI